MGLCSVASWGIARERRKKKNIMKFLLAVLFCVFGSLSAEPVQVKDCGSVDGSYVEIDINPCQKQPCELKRGTEVQIVMKLKPSIDVTKLESKIHGILSGIPIPFPFPEPNACKDQGLVCPLKKGQEVTFKTKLPIKKEYPAVKVVVKWELVDQASKDMICFEVPAQI